MIIGHILHIDNFGNLITNIRESALSAMGQSVTIIIGDHSIRGLVRTYADREGPVALFGSSGYLEISLPNASAAAFFKAKVGDEIRVKPEGN